MSNIDLARILTAEDRALARQRAEARGLLARTDWMVIRAAETGRPVPEDMRKARAAARLVLDGAQGG
ncbi:MAG: hypothetical protein EP307_08110 [Rhodobacteraceae bacterium]|nr:MAG: hypothetical protein EP307_08110 [Paracoccaceae bacterium]